MSSIIINCMHVGLTTSRGHQAVLQSYGSEYWAGWVRRPYFSLQPCWGSPCLRTGGDGGASGERHGDEEDKEDKEDLSDFDEDEADFQGFGDDEEQPVVISDLEEDEAEETDEAETSDSGTVPSYWQ